MTTSASSTVGELGEHALIARIAAKAPAMATGVHVGIGDDAAVVETDRGCLSVVTTDSLVEGIHFDRATTTAADIGHKALAVNLSDLAAMGAAPRHLLLSLALPRDLPVRDLDALVDALVMLARQHRAALVGGNITRSSGPLVIDVTALGAVKRRRVLTRGGARPGDDLYVSGSLGAAAAGLRALDSPAATHAEVTTHAEDAAVDICRGRLHRPEPRVRLGCLLGRTRAARACIDLSDGLADGIRQLAQASRVGATIDAQTVPVDPAARLVFESRGLDPLHASIVGGEDYELLFAAAPTGRRAVAAVGRMVKGLALTRIGRCTTERTLLLETDGSTAPLPEGFQHFAASSGPPRG